MLETDTTQVSSVRPNKIKYFKKMKLDFHKTTIYIKHNIGFNRGQNSFQLNHRNSTAIQRVLVLWFGTIRANIARLWRKHIFITAFTLITVNSRLFTARALCKTIPTASTRITPGHIVSTHVSNPLFVEVLTFFVTSCVEMVKLRQRQVGNCQV